MAMRMREYAVHADYAHICKYADADENLIHIIHRQYLPKMAIFWVSLALFSILSA